MKETIRCLSALGLPRALLRIVRGEIARPNHAPEPPLCPAWGYPPALIPLWMFSESTYLGVWHHPLHPDRALTFVTCAGARDWSARERARSFEQLVLRECSEEEEDDDDAQFLRSCGLSKRDLPARYDAFLAEHPLFRNGAKPASCYGTEPNPSYNGDFPLSTMDLSKTNVRNICGHEADERLRARLLALPDVPPWLSATDQRPVFDRLLSENDLPGAWMALNSPGWPKNDPADLRAALIRLTEAAPDQEKLRLQAEAWLVRDHEGELLAATYGERLPSADELAMLPHWAQVAYAARCARWAETVLGDHPLPALGAAIAAAERAAANADGGEIDSPRRQIEKSLKTNLTAGVLACLRAAAFALEAVEDSQQTPAHASKAALNAAYAVGALRPDKLSATLAGLRHDLTGLQVAAKRERWHATSPVGPDCFDKLGSA